MRHYLFTVLLLLALLALAGCGPSQDPAALTTTNEEPTGETLPEPDTEPAPPVDDGLDPALSAQLVAEGKDTVQDVLGNLDLANIPFGDLAGAADKFYAATGYDPDNQEAAFWAAFFELGRFLDSEASRAFFAKFGWEDLHDQPTFNAFIQQLIAALGGAGNLQIIIPELPEHGTIIGGTEEYVDLSYADIADYITVAWRESNRRAVDLLKGIGPEFSTSLTVGENTLVIDASEAKLIQTLYGSLEILTATPGVWGYEGIDPFISAYSTRDPDTGEFIALPTSADMQAFVRSGEAFPANEPGFQPLKDAIADTFGAIAAAVDALTDGTDRSDHLLNFELIFSDYDQQPAVASYSLQPYAAIAGQVETAVASGEAAEVSIYQPVAFIQDFGTCDPVAGAATDPAPGNAADPNLVPGTARPGFFSESIDDVAGIDPTAVPLQEDNRRYFQFTVPVETGKNLSIFTRTADGTDITTSGNVWVQVTDGEAVSWAHWDSDTGAGQDSNFGISFAEDFWAATTTPALPPIEEPFTILVGVTATDNDTGSATSNYTLYVWSDATTGVPVFLKGNGRNFHAVTYVGNTITLNGASVVDVLGRFWDDSLREAFTFDESGYALPYDNLVMRDKIQSIFPEADVSAIPTSGSSDVLASALSIEVPGLNDSAPTVWMVDESFGTLDFCAMPGNLTRANAFEGGFSPSPYALPF